VSSESSLAGSKTKLRIENLSDLVFGLALSIGSIILISKLPQNPGDLINSVVLFGFSFLIVIWIWSGYTRTMAVLPTEVRGTFLLNIALLFCVALEPYLFYVLQAGPLGLPSAVVSIFLDFASSVYAVDVGVMMFILAGLIYLILREEKAGASKGLPQSQLIRLRSIRNAEVSAGVIFLVSALPFVWLPDTFGSYIRFDLWYASFAVFFLMFYTQRRRA
jgi:uncharacterized membrane protein